MPGFFTPMMALLALLALPILVFYFLKLKRQRLEVSSLVLWQQVLADHRVNAPFQKFKRNLLLLLQLVVLALLVLAAMGPYWPTEVKRAQRLPILIDCSASMAALGGPSNPKSRLDVAKDHVQKLIDGLLGDQQLCLVSFSDTAQRLTGFTNNKRQLTLALEKIQIKEVPGDLQDVMSMADAMARAEPFDEIILFSDGNFPQKTDFALPFNVNYQRLDLQGVNLGIVALNAQRAHGGHWNIFVKIIAANAPANASVQIFKNDQLVETKDIHVEPQTPKKMVFEMTADKASQVTVKLLSDGFDALQMDNIAYLNLTELRPLRVKIAPQLIPEQLAMKAMDQVTLVDDEAIADLLLTDDSELDPGASPGAGVSVAKVIWRNGVLPDELTALMEVKKDAGSTIVLWNRTDPLFEYLSLNDIIILDEPVSKKEVRELDFESLGYRILIHGNKGPLLLCKQYDSHLEYILTVDASRTTLPYRVAFPVMLSNLVRIAMQQTGLQEIFAHRTGVFSPVNIVGEKQYQWRGPNGKTITVTSNPQGQLVGLACPRSGQYALEQGGKVMMNLSASLLSASESSLHSVEALQFRELSMQAAAKPLVLDRSFWPAVLWIALGVLLFEWWYFNRPRRRVAH